MPPAEVYLLRGMRTPNENTAIGIALAVLLTAGLGALGCASSRGGVSEEITRSEINEAKADAHAHIASANYMGAVEALQPLLDRSEQTGTRIIDNQVYSLLANAYRKLGAYDQALPNFEEALRLNYASAEEHLNLAEMLMEMGKIGRALTEFELAVKFGADDALARYNYGLALYEFGRYDAALAQWELAHKLEPGTPQYAEALGIGYSGRDDTRSLEYFELARELGADSPQFHNNFGILLQRIVRYRDAESEFRDAANLDPANPEFRSNLAAVYMLLERHAAAAALWRELVNDDPNKRRYRIYLAKSQYAQEQYAAVVATLEVWIESGAAERARPVRGQREPGLNEAYDTLAMSFRALEDLDKALVYIDKAVALQPDNTVHLNNYGVILAENGRIDEAKVQWEKVLQLEPDNAAAKQNLSSLSR